MSRVVHFEIPADDPDRAQKFYSGVFGWKINKWQGPVDYWLVMTGDSIKPGIDGAITRRQEPVTAVANTVDVPSVDDIAEKVISNGGKVVTPKMAVPGVGYMCYCRDTEGNTFAIMKEDKSAQ